MKLTIRNNLDSESKVNLKASLEVLILRVDGQPFAIPMSSVKHVLPASEATFSPVRAKYQPLVGFLEWQGESLPTLDLARHLELGVSRRLQVKHNARARAGTAGVAIIVESAAFSCALWSECVEKIRHLPRAALLDFPLETSLIRRPFFSATAIIDPEIVLMLDPDALLPPMMRDYLRTASKDFMAKRQSAK